MPCTKCGKPYADCKYPVSHNHPSIATITLPGKVASATNSLQPTNYNKMTAAQRAILNDFQP